MKTKLLLHKSHNTNNFAELLLSEKYDLLISDNLFETFTLLQDNYFDIGGIVLDLPSPARSASWFIAAVTDSEMFREIPLIVIVDEKDTADERIFMDMGVWCFIKKPIESTKFLDKVAAVIELSDAAVNENNSFMSKHDALTGLYNWQKFKIAVRLQLSNLDFSKEYYLIHIDVSNFKLINKSFGECEGDRVINLLAQKINEYMQQLKDALYCRVNGDSFAVFASMQKDEISKLADFLQNALIKYKPAYPMKICLGGYCVANKHIPVEIMYNNAAAAAIESKEKMQNKIAYYKEIIMQNPSQGALPAGCKN